MSRKATIVFSFLATSLLTASLCSQDQAISWGYDADGQVSDSPLEASFVDVAAGGFHCLALRSDGRIIVWGWNQYGQVSNRPTGGGFTQIAGGNAHSLGLRSNGLLFAWGRDNFGQVSGMPTEADFQDIACGFEHCVALRFDGTIVAWGNDTYGQVSQVPFGSDYVAVGAGRGHSIAIRANGQIVSWGRDNRGQVSGTPTTSGFESVDGGYLHSLALTSAGEVVAWGDDAFGQVSGAPTGSDVYVQVSAGGNHSLALKSDGSLVAWGEDLFGVTSSVPSGTLHSRISGDGAWNSMSLQATPGGNRWFHYEAGDTYFAVSEGVKRYWQDHRNQAGLVGARLASFENADEESFVDQTFGAPAGGTNCDLQYFIGLVRRSGNNWEWEEDFPYGAYTNWSIGAPTFSPDPYVAKSYLNGRTGTWHHENSSCASLAIYEWREQFDDDFDNDGLVTDDERFVYGTDPFVFDSDQDGLGDGLELGVVFPGPSTDLAVFRPDQDPNTTTSPTLADSDGGGVLDGVEDANQDGRVDEFDTDPNLSEDDQFAFYVSNLEATEQVQFVVYGADPGAYLVPFYAASPGTTDLGIGVVLDLMQPVALEMQQAPAGSPYAWTGPRVPPSFGFGTPASFQVLEIQFNSKPPRVSNAVHTAIGEL